MTQERGAWVVFVQADYGDEPAIWLYEKLGACERRLCISINPAPRANARPSGCPVRRRC